MTGLRCECVRIYRVAALAISAVLLVALVAMLLLSAEHASTTPTTTTVTSTTIRPSDRNDGRISEAERPIIAPARTLIVLNQLARFVCLAVTTAPTQEAVRDAVHAELVRLGVGAGAAALGPLTERVARAACEDAWLALGTT